MLGYCPWTLSVPRISEFSSSYAFGKLFAKHIMSADKNPSIFSFQMAAIVHCCGASVMSEQQHNQDLKKIYKREYEFSHSRPQSLRSFWPVIGMESSGLVQHRKSVFHGLPVKSSKSDWLTMWNEYSAHAQKIGCGQSSWSQPQARRIIGSGDENEHYLRTKDRNLFFIQLNQ